ncbi:uncharacterized protein TNCV_2493391 [Trichonephila clavipes]|uniref:Uncharacterized protein n=1 Tax=Trichonephila clavipes TaxID=2585209 RepID=A0A8X6RQJ7_TRICX|nr:uncharacterized protein TNCV_2493391 [Trichonephila clavipes]
MAPWPRALAIPQLVDRKNAGTIDNVEPVLDQLTQRTHLNDFLRGIVIGRLECGHTQLKVSEELGIAPNVISRLWQRFHDDGTVIRRYRIGPSQVITLSNEYRYIWQLLPKHQTCLVSSYQLPVQQFQGRSCTDA